MRSMATSGYHDEYHLVRTIMLVVLCISLVSIFVAFTTQQDIGITCTPNHQTMACGFNQIQNNINSTFSNLINSANNATTTPIIPLNNSADFGLGGVANVFIAIPNVFAHIFGWYNTITNQPEGFLFCILALIFDLGYFILFTLFVFVPTILSSLGLGIFAPIFALVEIAATGIFIVLALVMILDRIGKIGH